MDSNLTIRKINQTRYNLKKYLNDEWDISPIIDYSDNEIEKLYRTNKPISSPLQFGNASGCDFTLNHKYVKDHRIHIIYYNFPELGKPSVKINKTCAEKLNNLYKDEIINPEDSLIVILYNKISENLDKSIEDLYIKGQDELKNMGLSEIIHSENEKLNEKKYNNAHFKNIHLFHLDLLAIDITQHCKVPKHEVIRNHKEIDEILTKCNATINQLPVILRKDPMAKVLRLAPGDICKITRPSKTAGEIVYFRVCK